MKKYNIPRHTDKRKTNTEANEILNAKDEYDEIEDFVDELLPVPKKWFTLFR